MKPLIDQMVDRFLAWKLPEDFAPDGGISFKPTFNEGSPYEMKHNPSGTNLLTATQAKSMLEYVAGDLIARYGSEQFGLGRLDGQADAQAVAQILSASARPDPMTLRLD